MSRVRLELAIPVFGSIFYVSLITHWQKLVIKTSVRCCNVSEFKTDTGQKASIFWMKYHIYIYCSDNLIYGVAFARKFVDAPERVKPAPDKKNKKAWSVRMRMNLHNNEAGRQVSGFIWTLYPFVASSCLSKNVPSFWYCPRTHESH